MGRNENLREYLSTAKKTGPGINRLFTFFMVIRSPVKNTWGIPVVRCPTASHKKMSAPFTQAIEYVAAILRECSAVAAIEFAIEAPLFFLLIFGIINASDLAYTDYAVNRGVIASARFASVAATNSYVAFANGSTSSYQCPSSSDVRTSFLNATGPLIHADSLTGFGLSWGGTLGPSCGSGLAISTTPGEWVTVSVQYLWTPLVVGSVLGVALNLSAESTDQVIDFVP